MSTARHLTTRARVCLSLYSLSAHSNTNARLFSIFNERGQMSNEASKRPFWKTRLHCDGSEEPESVLLSTKVFGTLLLMSDWALWKHTIQERARSYDARPPLNSDTMLRYQC